MRPALLMLLLTGCLVCLAGCAQSKGAGPMVPPDQRVGSDAWRPVPTAVRIYPSTRFVNDDGEMLLEARIELFDQMGDSIKSSGNLRCELFAAGAAPGVTAGRLLYGWDVALATLQDQQRYYDPITRGYLFRLRIDDAGVARRRTVLRITFQPIVGDRLVDQKPVRTRW